MMANEEFVIDLVNFKQIPAILIMSIAIILARNDLHLFNLVKFSTG